MAYTVDELNDAYIIETKELHGYILDTQKHFIDLPDNPYAQNRISKFKINK